MICNDISWYIHGSSFYNSPQLFIRSEAITTTLARASFCEQIFCWETTSINEYVCTNLCYKTAGSDMTSRVLGGAHRTASIGLTVEVLLIDLALALRLPSFLVLTRRKW
jgi:hypothetical protein